MKVIAYNVTQSEKERLALANRKKHKITVIAYPLNENTVRFAEAKDTLIIIDQKNAVTLEILQKLALYGIKYMVTAFPGSLAVNLSSVQNFGITYVSIDETDDNSWPLHIIGILDGWEKSD